MAWSASTPPTLRIQSTLIVLLVLLASVVAASSARAQSDAQMLRDRYEACLAGLEMFRRAESREKIEQSIEELRRLYSMDWQTIRDDYRSGSLDSKFRLISPRAYVKGMVDANYDEQKFRKEQRRVLDMLDKGAHRMLIERVAIAEMGDSATYKDFVACLGRDTGKRHGRVMLRVEAVRDGYAVLSVRYDMLQGDPPEIDVKSISVDGEEIELAFESLEHGDGRALRIENPQNEPLMVDVRTSHGSPWIPLPIKSTEVLQLETQLDKAKLDIDSLEDENDLLRKWNERLGRRPQVTTLTDKIGDCIRNPRTHQHVVDIQTSPSATGYTFHVDAPRGVRPTPAAVYATFKRGTARDAAGVPLGTEIRVRRVQRVPNQHKASFLVEVIGGRVRPGWCIDVDIAVVWEPAG
ncbi:MAG: hypothetical protein RIB58_11230 [Phycisphaerales bacterium]